ncbi:tripartite tricarboxylate transporter TctB family protein [Roseovarius sp.]|uniref:tripartite tricarboxylate transporter TctB family protein n=1 Tax=Roseovarius sp. TaxID=1486281 RepID=UPI003B5A1AC8
MQTGMRKDIGAGLIALAIGIGVCWISLRYRIGTPSRMGPGLVPLALGIVLILCGIGAAVSGLRSSETARPMRARPMVMVTLSLVVFALTIERLGFVPASALLIVLSGLSESPPKWIALAVLCVVLIPAAYFLFIVLLGIPAPAFAWKF